MDSISVLWGFRVRALNPKPFSKPALEVKAVCQEMLQDLEALSRGMIDFENAVGRDLCPTKHYGCLKGV